MDEILLMAEFLAKTRAGANARFKDKERPFVMDRMYAYVLYARKLSSLLLLLILLLS